MSRYMNLRVKTEKAIRLTACMRDFGDYMGKWKEAIYELSCYNADMHFAYSIEVRNNHKNNEAVALIVKPEWEGHVTRLMTSIGYRNISTSSACVGLVDTEDATKYEWDHLNTYFDCFAMLE